MDFNRGDAYWILFLIMFFVFLLNSLGIIK